MEDDHRAVSTSSIAFAPSPGRVHEAWNGPRRIQDTTKAVVLQVRRSKGIGGQHVRRERSGPGPSTKKNQHVVAKQAREMNVSPSSAAASRGVVHPGTTVAVVGATGGVGQLAVAALLRKGYHVRAVWRKEGRAYDSSGNERVTSVGVDTREEQGAEEALGNADAVVCCTGTTAFPTKRWWAGGSPKDVDQVGVNNLVQAAKKQGMKRFVLVSSAGVDRKDSFPFAVMNLCGVLDYKKAGEEVLKESGIPYTVLRPSRLTDGPYTSYDLNTLLQGVSGTRNQLKVSSRDELRGECGRVALSEAIAQILSLSCTVDRTFHLESVEGPGAINDSEWERLFCDVASPAA